MVLEWYPWELFSEIEKIGEGGYGSVFRAKRKIGRIRYWDHQINQWQRYNDEYYALKTIKDPKELLNEVIYTCLFIV